MHTMFDITDEQFELLVSEAIDSLPKNYIDNMKNVVIITEHDPSPEQRLKLHLVNGVTLYGLYEGIPLTQRGGNYNLVLPDKITIFKYPIVAHSPDLASLKSQIKRTVWHEIAHHYGLDHSRISELENKA